MRAVRLEVKEKIKISEEMSRSGPYRKSKISKVLEFSRGMYYYESRLEVKDKVVANQIEVFHSAEDDTLGHRKIGKLLGTGKNRANRIMHKYGLEPRRRSRKYVYPGKSSEIFPNLANEPVVTELDIPVIFSDIFQFRLLDGSWLRGCLALHKQSRQVLSMVFDYGMDASLVVSTIQKLDFGLFAIWHSDQGKQYGAGITADKLLEKGFIASMSRAGTPTDNGYAERMIGTFKHSVVHRRRYENLGDFLVSAGRWINFYNQRRPHEGIGMMAPAKYARKLGMPVVPFLTDFSV